nr:MAG TPA: hypothetical protein [Bacteriophage sp.]
MSQLAALFLEVADTSFFYFGKGGAVWILILYRLK